MLLFSSSSYLANLIKCNASSSYIFSIPCHLAVLHISPLCLIPNPENHYFPPPLSPNFNKQPASIYCVFLKQVHFLNSQRNAATESSSRPRDLQSVTRYEKKKKPTKLELENSVFFVLQSLYLGTYRKISNYNNHFAYKLEGKEQLYIYYYSSPV